MLKIVLSLLVSFSVFADLEIKLVRALDGTVKKCENKYDLRTGRLGTYTASLSEYTVERGRVNAEIKLSFKKCEKSEAGEFSFVEMYPYDQFSFNALSLKKGVPGELIEAKPLRVKVVTIDENYKKLDSLKLDNGSEQTFLIETDLTGLSPEKPLVIEFIVLTQVEWTNADLKTKYKDEHNLGAHRLIIKDK